MAVLVVVKVLILTMVLALLMMAVAVMAVLVLVCGSVGVSIIGARVVGGVGGGKVVMIKTVTRFGGRPGKFF